MPDQLFRDAAYPAETDEVFVTLVTIAHPDMATEILLCDGGEDIVYAAELLDAAGNVAALEGTYVNFPIEIVPPGESDEQLSGTLRVANIDQQVSTAVDALAGPATITITAVLASDPEVIVGGPHLLLELVNVRGDALVVEGEVARPRLTEQPWPKHWMRPSVFRAAARVTS
jgi:hypothetical protein